ncbi:uncharacterized protein LOC142025077 isoform X3 [Carettochelys insculpta]|uniref:uncharacterized protein LOC142025077 isoform X3 n=1 Tax=Carettochelys insculpta TaxID=44489 RepID=UPI003EBBC2AE
MAAPSWSERVRELLKRMNNFHEPGSSQERCLPFLVAGQRVGSAPPQVAQRLQDYPAVFTVYPAPGRIELHPQLVSHEQRTAAVGQVLGELRELGDFPCLRGWRDEHYEVMAQFWDPPLFSMERAATCGRGHCGRAGGDGDTVEGVPGGSLYPTHTGCPGPARGHHQVKEAIPAGDFKPNCALVALDFLIRHGHIQPDHGENRARAQPTGAGSKGHQQGWLGAAGQDCAHLLLPTEPHYAELVMGLHRPL